MKLLELLQGAQPRPPERPSILASNDVCPACGGELADDGEYTIRYDGDELLPYRCHVSCDDTLKFFDMELGSLDGLI